MDRDSNREIFPWSGVDHWGVTCGVKRKNFLRIWQWILIKSIGQSKSWGKWVNEEDSGCIQESPGRSRQWVPCQVWLLFLVYLRVYFLCFWNEASGWSCSLLRIWLLFYKKWLVFCSQSLGKIKKSEIDSSRPFHTRAAFLYCLLLSLLHVCPLFIFQSCNCEVVCWKGAFTFFLASLSRLFVFLAVCTTHWFLHLINYDT